MAIVTVGVDLAKNVFAVHGVDESGQPVLVLSELGIVLPLKAATVRREAHKHLEDLPGWCNTVVGDALSELTHLDERISQYDHYIAPSVKEDEQARQLMRNRIAQSILRLD